MHSFDSTVGRLLVETIQKEIADRGAILLRGSVKDIEEYRSRCGYLRALGDVQEWLKDIEKRLTTAK